MTAAQKGSGKSDPAVAWREAFGHHHAFIVGIDKYKDVSPLRTAVNDATRLAQVLKDDHDFDIHEPLLDEDATHDNFIRLLTDTLPEKVKAGDRVLFYFAGHGVAISGDKGMEGYMLPVDAVIGRTETYVPMQALQDALDALKCRHLLLILDCCFSGAFKWATQHRAAASMMPKRIYAQRFARFIEEPAHQIITSAAHDQKALDVLKDGLTVGDRGSEKWKDEAGAHSPFAIALFDALGGAADVKIDREGDGVITATEIYGHIRDRLEPASMNLGAKHRQSPSFFPLPKHETGEFMFVNKRHRINLPERQERSPYKGLEPFDFEDRSLFYGRKRVVDALTARLTDPLNRLLVVVGPTGAGKSSVVRAGLLPALRQKGAAEVMRPGTDPNGELDRILATAQGPMVLIVDQYEEVVTRCADAEAREKFDQRLYELLEAGDPVERIVVTVRSDFESQVNQGALKTFWQANRYGVPGFEIEELRQAIELPAIQEVMVFEPPTLVDKIIADVVQAPGVLPLLSYTLNELFNAYRNREDDKRELHIKDYEALGGVSGALEKKAQALIDEVDKAGNLHVLRKIMLRLVTIRGGVASQRVAKSELRFSGVPADLVDDLLETLRSAQLVVGDDHIEPAHDALLRQGPIAKWIGEARHENLIIGEQLKHDARKWHDDNDNPARLWHANAHLQSVRDLLDEPDSCWFNAVEVDFIEASVRHKTRRARFALATAASVFAIITALMIWGWVKQTYANNAIENASGFTDDMLGEMMKKLRVVERTHDARKHLVEKVRDLHDALSSRSGADLDNDTSFWTHLLEGDADLDKARLEDSPALELARYQDAATHYQKAIAVAEQQLKVKDSTNWRRNLSIVYGQLGDMAKARADFNEARRRYRQALEIDKELAARPDAGPLALRDEFVSHFRLADLERRHAKADPLKLRKPFQTERYVEARRQFELAHTLAERLVKDNKDSGDARRDLAMVLVELGNSSMSLGSAPTDEHGRRAVGEYQRAVDWALRWPADDVLHHPDTRAYLDIAYTQLGFLQLKAGRLEPARRALNEALKLSYFPDKPGAKPKSPPTEEQQNFRYTNYLNLATVESRGGNEAGARAAFTEALAIADHEIATGRTGTINWRKQSAAAARGLAELGAFAQRERHAARSHRHEARAAAR